MRKTRLSVISGGTSSVTTAPERAAASESAHAAQPPGSALSRAAYTAGLAVALVAIAVVTGGGLDQNVPTPGNTWTEIALLVLGAAAIGLGLISRAPGERRPGWVTAGLMALLFADTAASIAWSWAPDSSWLGASQMLAYLAVFAGAILLARPWARGWPTLIGSLVLWAATLCAWSLLVKIFPSTLAPGNQYGRLQAPFGYWNAIALCAAMGLPCCLWLGARRDQGRRLAGLSAPALALLLSVLVLSYSRSADFSAVVAAGLWLAIVPLRLRALAMLLVGAIGAAAISGWFLTHPGLFGNGLPIGVQDHAGRIFGVIVLIVLVLVSVVGVAVSESLDRTTVRKDTRRRIGGAIIGLLVIGVVAVLGAVAVSSRGLTGEISYRFHELTSPVGTASVGSASRVFQFGSSRPAYWHEALAVGDSAVLKGVGELGFSVARLQHPLNSAVVFQAHSYVFETYADLGIIGLVLSGALLAAWLVAAGRALLSGGPRWSTLAPGISAERAGLWTLAAVVLAFGVQGTLDWTWYFTGLSIPALLAAGWLAGRGTGAPPSASSYSPSLPRRPGVLGAIVLLVAVVLVGGWLSWRPLESAQLVNDATGLADARAAQQADPFSLLPYDLLSLLDQRLHRNAQAVAELQHAIRVQPHNPQPYEWLAQLYAQRRQWALAIKPLQQVHSLDLTGDGLATANDRLLVEVSQRLAAAAK